MLKAFSRVAVPAGLTTHHRRAFYTHLFGQSLVLAVSGSESGFQDHRRDCDGSGYARDGYFPGSLDIG